MALTEYMSDMVRVATENGAEILGVVDLGVYRNGAVVLCNKPGYEFVVWYYNYSGKFFYTGSYFPYHDFVDTKEEEARQEAVLEFKKRSMIDTMV